MNTTKNDLLSVEQAAKILGLAEISVKQYGKRGRLKHAKNDENGMFFTREEVEEYAKKRLPSPWKKADTSVVIQPQQVQTVKKTDDAQILQTVLSSVLSFLSAHGFAVGLQSLQEVKAQMRLWDIKTPQCDIRVVAEGNEISVLADSYQKQLEQEIKTLKDQLREAQTKLKYLRDKPQQRTLHEYAQPFSVFIDAREDCFFVYTKEFPFASCERTEDEALAAFRRMLWGYRAWLQLHEKQLTSKMQEDYCKLDDLLVER